MNKNNLLFFIFACSTLIVGCNLNNTPQTTKPVPVDVVKIQQSNIPITKEYIALTNSVASVNIPARVEGFLNSYNFIEGSIVKKGQLLFVIDPAPFKAAVDAAQGALDQSIATSEFDRLDAARQYALYKKHAASEQDSDQATATYKASLALIETNKANLEQAKINLSYCYIYSPITGMIGADLVNPGNLVGGTEQTLLTTVVQLDPIYVNFNPSATDYNEILQYKTNTPFQVTVTLPQQKNSEFKGAVDFINNKVDTPTSTIQMRATVGNPENLLLPGTYVNVTIHLGYNPKAILVPSIAVMSQQSIQYVYVVNANNEVVAARITSSMQYKNNLVVETGLKPGDLVITTNLQKLHPGMKVIPNLATEQKASEV